MNDQSSPLDNQAPASRRAQLTGIVCLALVGAVFIFSAWAKLVAPGVFEAAIVQQGLFETRSAAALPARLLIALELAIGLGLLQPWRRRDLFASSAATLLLGFSAWLAYLLIAGKDTEDCGCFGELLKISPGIALLRNVVLLGLIGAAWRFAPQRRPWAIPLIIFLLAGGITIAFAPIPAVATSNANDNSLVSSKPSSVTAYTQFSDGSANLLVGTHVVAFLSLDCEHCMEVAGTLAANADQLPPIRVVYLGQAEQVPDFEGMSGTAFPWHLSDPGRFFDHLGDAPPRIYLLRDGRELGRWDQADFTPQALFDAIGG